MKLSLIIASALAATFPAVTNAGCACSCEESALGSGVFNEVVYDPELESGSCSYAPTGTCEGAIVLDMACYKCGQSLDCVVDDISTPLTDAQKSNLMTVLEDPSYFCGDTQGKKLVTCSGQQNCDNLDIGFASDVGLPLPVIGDITQCPISGQGLSNFGTYTVKIADGDNCWTCSAAAECSAANDLSSITTTCSVTSPCTQVQTEVLCATDKCDTTADCTGTCDFCGSRRRLGAH